MKLTSWKVLFAMSNDVVTNNTLVTVLNYDVEIYMASKNDGIESNNELSQ